MDEIVVITGGIDNNNENNRWPYGNSLSRVTWYNKEWDSNNFLGHLPEMQEARMQHGCTYYYRSQDNNQHIVSEKHSKPQV